ncbi:MAG TPA: antibiotic biosynthesis monooxygenase family protein [Patescibacteria group bacterium]|nr:antibiotic biosynthesis monooxygenase family protein [Patescibacteria group bacterium]
MTSAKAVGTMIERHVTFHVNPGAEADFEALFVERYRPAMSRQPGFVKVELLRSIDDPQVVRMVIRFNSAAEAANWRDSADHAALKPVLQRLYSTIDPEVFDVVA